MPNGPGHRHPPVTARSAGAIGPARRTCRADLAELWQTDLARRHAVQRRLAEALAAKTSLRAGITASRATDIALAVLAPESYRLLVGHCGWSAAGWESWAADTRTLQLLGNTSEDAEGDAR